LCSDCLLKEGNMNEVASEADFHQIVEHLAFKVKGIISSWFTMRMKIVQLIKQKKNGEAEKINQKSEGFFEKLLFSKKKK